MDFVFSLLTKNIILVIMNIIIKLIININISIT